MLHERAHNPDLSWRRCATSNQAAAARRDVVRLRSHRNCQRLQPGRLRASDVSGTTAAVHFPYLCSDDAAFRERGQRAVVLGDPGCDVCEGETMVVRAMDEADLSWQG